MVKNGENLDIRVDSHQHGGRISIESNIKSDLQVEHPIYLSPRVEIHEGVKIEKYTFINYDTIVYKNVNIGRYCSIGRNCEIGLSKHPTEFLSTHLFQIKDNSLFNNSYGYDKLNKVNWIEHETVNIGNDVWIGSKVSIMNGVTIGNGSIIGAGAVVTKDVLPYAIAAGVPAKIIRKRFNESIIKELESLKWWELDLKDLENINFSNIKEAIEVLKNKKQIREIQ